MLIVDSQVHIWPANTPEHPWPPGSKSHTGKASYSADELLVEMGAAGVNRAVLVPPSWSGDSNDFVLEAARKHPDRFAVMGRMNIDQPANEAMVSTLKQTGMKGLRLTLQGGQSIATGSKLDWLWPAAERANVPLMMNARGKLLPDAGTIAEKHRGLKIAIDNLALPPDKKDDAAFADLPQLLALAKWPNISVKITALPWYSSENYPYRGLHKYIKQVYDSFGPERIFWGADLSRLPCTYQQAITMFTEELPWLTTADKELIMGKAVCNWMGWTLPAGL